MRILIDLQSCQNGSRFRGLGRYTLNITKALLRLETAHEFVLLLSDQFPDAIEHLRRELTPYLSQNAFRICSIPDRVEAAGGSNAWRYRAAEIVRSAFIAQCKPDVVFIPSFFEGLWDNVVVSLDKGDYVIVATLHDLIPLEDPERYLASPDDREAYIRRLHDLGKIDRFIAISDYVSRDAQTRLAIPQNKIQVVLNGVDEEFAPAKLTEADRDRLMQRLAITKPFVFNNSPLEQRKNLEGLISGFASMSAQYRNAHQLVISGKFDDYARNHLRSLAEAEGLAEGTLILTGYVSDEDMIALYSECALFAFPSHSEGFGLPPLEAMACGAPVVVANATSLPEVVDRPDLLVDPTDPLALAKAMELILGNPSLQAELRNYGLSRARKFTWTQNAKMVLAELEACASKRTSGKVTVQQTERDKAPLAFVCMDMAETSHIAGRLLALLSELSIRYDVTLISESDGEITPWIKAPLNIRSPEWFERNSWRFGDVIYAGDSASDDKLLSLMTIKPGLYFELAAIPKVDEDVTKVVSLSISRQRDIVASVGVGGLMDAEAVKDENLRAPSQVGARFRNAAALVLREGESGMPHLPLRADEQAARKYRGFMQVEPKAPLIAIVADHANGGAELLARIRALVTAHPHAFVLVHALGADKKRNGHGPVHLQGNIRVFAGDIAPHYRGLLSTADALIVAPDVMPCLRKRLLDDAATSHVMTICADESCNVAEAVSNVINRQEPMDGPSMTIAAPTLSEADTLWLSKLNEGLTQLSGHPLSQADVVASKLPGSVRGYQPDGFDLSKLASVIEQNQAYEREPLICFDISAFCSPNAPRRLDSHTRAQLLALLHQGGRNICAVYATGDKFCIANYFISKEIGLTHAYATDQILYVRPGDKIVGLDVLHSFHPLAMAALKRARLYGAMALYFAAGQNGFQSGGEKGLAQIACAWAEDAEQPDKLQIILPASPLTATYRNNLLALAMQELVAAKMPAAFFSLDEVPDALTDDLPADSYALLSATPRVEASLEAIKEKLAKTPQPDAALHYTVMGHLLGSYSLAIINRSVARTLEQAYAGRVHYAPFETDPISHTEGVPAGEKALIAKMMDRPRPLPQNEVMICQHWPIMPPREKPRLALSLFPWEESHVPDGIVHTLSNGFDAIISPSQSVTSALSVSGCSIPVATIGQPVDLTPFEELARKRKPNRPIRKFVHISSAFPRKGVDVLLEAWAKAFTKDDDVELTIKSFPNPHNDVTEQLEQLQKAYLALAPVKFVNRDVEPEELLTFYRDYDAMVLPSRGEGYNLPALESMAAGLPLIVTGHGGHRDFCGPEQARMVRFTFRRSASHTSGSHALWLEPDVEDLVEALRELHDPANAELVEKRRTNAMAAAREEGDASGWLRRFNAMVRDIQTVDWQSTPRVGWVSTWNIQCGIAQYSSYLLDRMSKAQRANILIYCDRRSPAAVGNEELACKPAWDLIGDKASEIVETALADGTEALVIQHQDGLISWEQLGALGHHPKLEKIVSVAVLHNVRKLLEVGGEEVTTAVSGLAKMSRVLVHNTDDMNFLLGLGLRQNLGLFPHGAFAAKAAPWPRDLGPSDGPIIGCHGFFFRHKGIDKLIRAAGQLRREWPGLRLRLVNARFPGDEHDEVIRECQQIAIEVGMDDAIEWHLDFLPVDEIEELLSGCDVNILPYDESNDSASGAIRTCLATMVPLIATRVKIFAELSDAVAWAQNNDPDELARAIRKLLKSSKMRREVQAGMYSWLHSHDWNRMASILERMVAGLVQEKRMHWDQPRHHFV